MRARGFHLFQGPQKTDLAVDVLWPTFRTAEFVGAGPFQRHLPNGETSGPIRVKVWQRFMMLLSRLLLARFVIIFILKYIFARYTVGAAGTDIVRACTCFFGLNKMNGHLVIIHDVLRTMDQAPHDVARMSRLRKVCWYGMAATWLYVAYRIILDLFAFHMESRFQQYIETELMISFNRIPKLIYFVIYLVAHLDIIVNRVFVSGTMSFLILFYVFVNMFMDVKFTKWDNEITECVERSRSEKSSLPLAFRVSELRIRHAKLCDVIQQLDDIFCSQAFVWHTSALLVACMEATAMVQMSKRQFELLRFLGNMGNTSFMVVSLFAVTGSAALLCECGDRSRSIVNSIHVSEQGEATRALAHEVRLLLSQMNQRVEMTAWRFYKLDRSSILQTYGACITYVSLVVQSAEDILEE